MSHDQDVFLHHLTDQGADWNMEEQNKQWEARPVSASATGGDPELDSLTVQGADWNMEEQNKAWERQKENN